MESVDNLVIEHLKGLRSDVAALRANMQDEFKDVKHRLSELEIQVVASRRETWARKRMSIASRA